MLLSRAMAIAVGLAFPACSKPATPSPSTVDDSDHKDGEEEASTTMPPPVEEVPAPPADEDTSKTLVSLYRDWDARTGPCVWVTLAQDHARVSEQVRELSKTRPSELPPQMEPCYESIDALRGGEWSFADVRPINLAAVLRHLRAYPGSENATLYRGPKSLSFDVPADVFDLPSKTLWSRNDVVRRPETDKLQPVAFDAEGKRLTFDQTTSEYGSPGVITSERVVAVFKEGSVEITTSPLPTKDYQQERIAAVDEAFDAPMEAMVRITVESGDWYLGLGTTPAPRYLWRGADGALALYASFGELATAHPGIVAPPGLRALATVVNDNVLQKGFSPILDAEAWKAEYKEQGYRTLTNSYYDKGKTFETTVTYTIADFDGIVDPAYEGGTLRLYLSGSRNHQPYRVDVKLSTLTTSTALKPEFLATFEESGRGLRPSRCIPTDGEPCPKL